MSGTIFVISDPHFGHVNMSIKRGFSSIEEHDQHIVNNWNSVVGKRDTVYILGDISMERSTVYPILDSLKGYKKVVLGNHDKPQHVPELLKYVNSVCGMIKLKGYILTHCPIHESELNRFKANIHGHTHDKSIWRSYEGINYIIDDRYINVSCEAINYTPIAIDEISTK